MEDEEDSSEENNKHLSSDLQRPMTKDRAKKLAERDAYLRRQPNQTITLIKSQFPGKDPFLFFPYPPYLNIQRPLPTDLSRLIQYNQKDLGLS